MKFTPEEARIAVRALYNTTAYHSDGFAKVVHYVDSTGIMPEWVETFAPDYWFVRHDGETHEVFATSEADAINRVRYRIYGTKPMRDLPPFEAICPCAVMMDAIGGNRVTEAACQREAEHAAPKDLFGMKVKQTTTNKLSKKDALARLRRMAV